MNDEYNNINIIIIDFIIFIVILISHSIEKILTLFFLLSKKWKTHGVVL
jgi:hypothetical protein